VLRRRSGPDSGRRRGTLSIAQLVPRSVPLLADGFTVYEYDRRGRGGSTDTPPYAVQREVEDPAALVEQAGGVAFLHEFSSGALLALQAAAGGISIPRMSLPAQTLVVDSEGSSDDLVGMAGRVAAGLPQARHRRLPGEWHGVPDDVLARVLAEFFASA
jgi:hypothetical protein